MIALADPVAPFPQVSPSGPITPGPITVVEPQLAMLTSGRLDRLLRPDATLARSWRVGQRLWVREPFHLPVQYNGLAPTAADSFGARPIFAVDLAGPPDPKLFGKRHFARCLPKAWHRQHLAVTRIERRRLQAITQQEIEQQGFRTRAGFAAHWDRNADFGQGAAYRANGWAQDPDVLVIHFEWFPHPLPNQGD